MMTPSKWSPMKQRENRARANNWIAECKPKAWLLACEKAIWIQHRAERESANRTRNLMLKRMNERGDMSFESWIQEQEATAAEAEDEAAPQTQRHASVPPPRKTMLREHFHNRKSEKEEERKS